MTDHDALALPADDSQPDEPESDALVPVEIDPAEPATGGQIYDLMPALMRDLQAIPKDEQVEKKYKFRGIDTIVDHIASVMRRHPNLTTGTKVRKYRTWNVTQSQGNRDDRILYGAGLILKITFFAPDGSHVTKEGAGEGMDYGGDKATAKAMSMAYKYALGLGMPIPFSFMDADGTPLAVPNPKSAKGAPKAQPRGERVTLRELNILKDTWIKKHPGLVTDEQGAPLDGDHKLANFSDWVQKLAGLIPEFDVNDPNAWPRDLYNTCLEDLKGASK